MTWFDRAHDFLLAFHSNYGRISHPFRDTTRYWLKIAWVMWSRPRPFWDNLSRVG